MRPPAAIRDSLHSRRLHVQFDVKKAGVLERALVPPVAVNRASAGRALIGASAGNDLVFADNMATGNRSRARRGIVRDKGSVGK